MQGVKVLLGQHLVTDLAASVLGGWRCCDTMEVHGAGLVGVIDQLLQLAKAAFILVKGLLGSRGTLAVQKLLYVFSGDATDFLNVVVMFFHVVGKRRGQINQPTPVRVREYSCAVHLTRMLDGVLVHALLKVLVDGS